MARKMNPELRAEYDRGLETGALKLVDHNHHYECQLVKTGHECFNCPFSDCLDNKIKVTPEENELISRIERGVF